MSRIVVCMDCPNYQKGGHCRHKNKDVAALAPACDYAIKTNQTFNPEDEDMTTPENPNPSRSTPSDIELVEEMPTPYPTKTCPRCKRTLPHEAFGKHARTRDGLQPYCKDCRSEARQGKTSRPGRETKASYVKTAEQPKTVVVREILTDKEMVDILREHGWTVTCTRTVTEEL